MSGYSPAPLAVHPGYVAGNWYQPINGSVVGGGALPANTILLLPFVLAKPITIQALGARLATLSAAGNFQLAIYANNAATGRPTGTALVSTGNISTGAAVAISAAVAAQATLPPGIYWMAINQDNAVAAYQTLTGDLAHATYLIGSATLGTVAVSNSTANLSLTVAQTFGTWPSLTAASFTESTTAGRSALVFMQAA